MLIAFFDIFAADDSSRDEQLKTDINAIRTSLTRSGFKTRFAAVLLSDCSILQAPELEERLTSIRRLTSLDSKTGLFFMPPMASLSEIATFVHSVMTTLQPLCVEYYRDLTKHARRKKARGGPPPSVSSPVGGASQSLSTPGWNVRYEVKQAVFAEFRQEMDVAERHYSAAIDELFNPEGIFEATASWSPRWEDARLLCDSLAVRDLRCQLWNTSTTGAAQSWVNYRARMKDLVDRRGKGAQTYAWEAWEARWAEIMAQLIQRVDVPALQKSLKQPEESAEVEPPHVYAMSEKAFAAAERVPPFHYLHHSGYWLKLALRGSRARKKMASLIPEEDRLPPGQSPASLVANRSRNYDCYLVPDPHEEYIHDHVTDITKLLNEAADVFETKSQSRMTEIMKLDIGNALADSGHFDEAVDVLEPLWRDTTWRDDNWLDIFGELLLLLRRCTEQQRNIEVLLATTYELLSIPLSLSAGSPLDLGRCLDKLQPQASGVTSLTFKDRERLCPLVPSFAFESKGTHVGERLACQLTLTSRTIDKSRPVTLSNVALTIGFSKNVNLAHDSGATDSNKELVDLSHIAEEYNGEFRAKVNLVIRPAQRRIFNFHLSFREAETFRVNQIAMSFAGERFKIEHAFTDEEALRSNSIAVDTGSVLQQKVLPHVETTTVTVSPKPPKLKVLLHGVRKQYYTDERICLTTEIVNEEAETVDGNLSAQIESDAGLEIPLHWIEQDDAVRSHELSQTSPSTPIVKDISQLEPRQSYKTGLLIAAPSEPSTVTILIEANYALSTDTKTPLRKTLTLNLSFATLFEVKFTFGPLLYQDAWPSYFDPDKDSTREQSGGIPQLWLLDCQTRLSATESILLRNMEPVVDNVVGDSKAAFRELESKTDQKLGPTETAHSTFQIRTQKHTLDDRRPTALESTLAITWSRNGDREAVTTYLPVPRLTIPVSEPRVLCTLFDMTHASGDATLLYHIENPSTHFLTFALSMEASEEFAFSGPKYRTLSLAPLSRHKVEYHIALHDQEDQQKASEGRWIWPSLQVIDSYYQKTLRVHPGGTAVKLDEKQNIGVWIETS